MLELQRGQGQALDVLIARWERPIKSYLYRFTQDAEWVEELAQETFVKVYLNAGRFDQQRKFAPWIYTIASNLGKNLLRWKSRRPHCTHSLDDIRDHPEMDQTLLQDPGQEHPAQSMQGSEALDGLRAAIARLPNHLKDALILHYYQGLAYDEVAQVIGCSARGVETRLYRARKQLKVYLEQLPL
jgi:RNA polymerase sigma-70 factor (ECF subfamily)